MEAFGSPMAAAAIMPPFKTIDGLTPKKAGFHNTRSASFPASTDPTSCDTPWAIAGLILHFEMYRFFLNLFLPQRTPLRCPALSDLFGTVRLYAQTSSAP